MDSGWEVEEYSTPARKEDSLIEEEGNLQDQTKGETSLLSSASIIGSLGAPPVARERERVQLRIRVANLKRKCGLWGDITVL